MVGLSSHGLFRSDDFGASFRRIEGFAARPSLVGFGAPRPGGSEPTMYVWSSRSDDPARGPEGVVDVHGYRLDGGQGLYRSHDLGASWERVDRAVTDPLRPRLMVPDRQHYGRVYVCSAQASALYLVQPNDTAPTLVLPAEATVASSGSTRIAIRVGDPESHGQALVLRCVASSDPAALPPHAVAIAGTGGDRELVLPPIGSSPITLTLRLDVGFYTGHRSSEARIRLVPAAAPAE